MRASRSSADPGRAKPRLKPLSPKQAALVERLRGGRLLMAYQMPGRDNDPDAWYIEHPYSNEDGRTVQSLLSRGLLHHEGGNMWTPREQPHDELAALIQQEGE